MKKFSKITNQEIDIEPKITLNESDTFKKEIISLIDRLIKVKSYGSVDNRFLSGSLKIDGKDMLAEAIVDLLHEKTKKEQTKILESLKSKIKDWKTIDESIELLNDKVVSLNNKLKFNSILERYKDDNLVIYLECVTHKLGNKSIEDYILLTDKSDIKDEYKSKIIDLLNKGLKK